MVDIKKYRIGNPIPTDSVVVDMEIMTGKIPFLTINETEKTLSMKLEKTDRVYGLGETVRGMNKRGWTYTSNNSDDPVHTEDKRSLYASQNFILITSVDSSCSLGIYVDTPGKVTFDIGYTKLDELKISFEDLDADLYFIEGKSPLETVSAFRHMIGRSYIPPRWAFGFGQSRWGYKNESDIRRVADEYAKAGIPIDMIYMDIDYMERFKDFTVDEEAFPDFPAFVNEMRENGIHLIPIIDAGVKIEEGYDVYEEGVKGDYFCKKENGENLVAAVWPGQVHFPDFLKDSAREWFGNKYKVLMDQGIDGFWNDMNEPAIFYTEDHLAEVFEKLDDYKGKNLDIWSFFKFKDLVGSIANNAEDYRRFYHEYKGQKIRHDKVHNLYGYNMTKAAGEAFERLCPNKRILMFSRSSYIGMHRYGGVWCGDNQSWWSHLLLNIQQMPALSMCGFLYSGADIGGFGADTTEDLLLRWTAFGIFTPLFRNHSALGTREQEMYQFPSCDIFKNLVELRYALIPYLYSEFMKAVLEEKMLFKPLGFEYLDERSAEVEDQLLLGDSLMLAPVYKQNASGRMVYLPEDMKMVRFRAWNDYDEEVLTQGDHYVKAGLDEVLVFIRKGKVLLLADIERSRNANNNSNVSAAYSGLRSGDVSVTDLKYICYEAAAEDYRLYTDDGISRI
ncbi:MAG: alpha-glucosidase [Eubacterium sp.]|nr:alpha-glucosidase [Eubacterium sp.]